jgi:hypothetical protein
MGPTPHASPHHNHATWEAEAQVLGGHLSGPTLLPTTANRPQSLTPGKGVRALRAQRRPGAGSGIDPEHTHRGQLHCDNPHPRAFDVTPTSYHSAFRIVLR